MFASVGFSFIRNRVDILPVSRLCLDLSRVAETSWKLRVLTECYTDMVAYWLASNATIKEDYPTITTLCGGVD